MSLTSVIEVAIISLFAGRSGNLWISPKGAMMFSMALSFPLSAKLSQRMSLLQHLVAMAMVHGVRTIPGYEVSLMRSSKHL